MRNVNEVFELFCFFSSRLKEQTLAGFNWFWKLCAVAFRFDEISWRMPRFPLLAWSYESTVYQQSLLGDAVLKMQIQGFIMLKSVILQP